MQPQSRRVSVATSGLTGLKQSSTGLKVGMSSDKMKTILGRGLKLNDVSKFNNVLNKSPAVNQQSIQNLKK